MKILFQGSGAEELRASGILELELSSSRNANVDAMRGLDIERK